MDISLLHFDRREAAQGSPYEQQRFSTRVSPLTEPIGPRVPNQSPQHYATHHDTGHVASVANHHAYRFTAWKHPSFPPGPSDSASARSFPNTGQSSISYFSGTASARLSSDVPDLSFSVSSIPVSYDFSSVGPTIPQWPYQSKILNISMIEDSVKFETPSRCGIHVTDVLKKKFDKLDGRDDPMFAECGTSVSLRFEWPGCQPWSRQIRTQDGRRKPNPISRAKLASEIIKTLKRFIYEMKDEQQADQEPQWRIGPGFIELDHLVLVSLDRVSKASWQPQFCLKAGI